MISSTIKRALLAAIIGVVAASLLPGDVNAQCYQCVPDNGGYTCGWGYSSGWEICQQGCGQECCETFQTCIHVESLDYDSIQLEDGTPLRGVYVAADAFSVRSCTGQQLAVLYTDEGLRERSRAAARIVLN